MPEVQRHPMQNFAELSENSSTFIGQFEAMAIVVDQHPNSQVRAQFIFHNHDLPQSMHFRICSTIEEGRAFLSQY